MLYKDDLLKNVLKQLSVIADGYCCFLRNLFQKSYFSVKFGSINKLENMVENCQNEYKQH